MPIITLCHTDTLLVNRPLAHSHYPAFCSAYKFFTTLFALGTLKSQNMFMRSSGEGAGGQYCKFNRKSLPNTYISQLFEIWSVCQSFR